MHLGGVADVGGHPEALHLRLRVHAGGLQEGRRVQVEHCVPDAGVQPPLLRLALRQPVGGQAGHAAGAAGSRAGGRGARRAV